MTIEQFTKKYCRNCGTQRCGGPETEWFEGCQYKNELNVAVNIDSNELNNITTEKVLCDTYAYFSI